MTSREVELLGTPLEVFPCVCGRLVGQADVDAIQVAG